MCKHQIPIPHKRHLWWTSPLRMRCWEEASNTSGYLQNHNNLFGLAGDNEGFEAGAYIDF